jgi:hypothetical protein
MKGLETGFDVVVALVKGGVKAAWELIKEKLTDLKDTVISGITSFVIDSIVHKAIPKIIAMFIPGAGFISAIISIYDTVKVFIDKLAKIIAVVKSFVDSIVAIAAGQIGGAAKRVEGALAGGLSLAISFLAGFLGLGNIAEKILGVIEKIRASVDKALDAVIGWLVEKAKGLFGKLFGKKDDKNEDGPPDEKTAKAVAIVQGRVASLVAKGILREQLRAQVQAWAPELGVRRVGMEDGAGGDSIFVENSPRRITNTLIGGNIGNVYAIVLEIAKELLAKASTSMRTARGPWNRSSAIEVAMGSDPLVIASALRAQAPASGFGVPKNVGVPIEFAGAPGVDVTAARRGGIANYEITKLGKYADISEMLVGRGTDMGGLAKEMAEANRTHVGDPEIFRMIALMHGAEPARQALAAATGKLALGSALQEQSTLRRTSTADYFGMGDEGGIDPVSPKGVRRAEAMAAGKVYPEGTRVSDATDEHVKSVARAVFLAVEHLEFSDMGALRKHIYFLIEAYDKASLIG